jgi:hypothetical protein
MPKPADFMVILRNDIHENNIELLGPVVHRLSLKTGLTANVLWCKSTESADGGYLSVEAKLLADTGFSTLLIPHWLILAIVGSKNFPPVGFVWSSEQPAPPMVE